MFSQLLHLSGQSLSHITLCISATSSEGLVSSTVRSSSTLKRLPIGYSSSPIGLFLKRSSCLELSIPLSGLALYLTLLHSQALLLFGLLHVLLPSTPWTRAIYSDCATLLGTAQIPAGTVVACSTRLHQTSSIDMIRLVVACIHHDVHDSTVRCCASFNCASMRHPQNQLRPTPTSFLKLCTL